MPSENELLQRIHELEAENSELHDKLDLIYAIVAPPDDHDSDAAGDDAGPGGGLVQISS